MTAIDFEVGTGEPANAGREAPVSGELPMDPNLPVDFAMPGLNRTSHDVPPSVPQRNANFRDIDLLDAAFSPQAFRRYAHLAVSKLTEHLADTGIRGLDLRDPADLRRAAKKLMDKAPQDPEGILGAIIDLYLRTGIQVYSPGYMGRQFSGVVPMAGIFDLVSSIVNQPSSFYEAGPLPNVVERLMADEFSRLIGWEIGPFALVTTSGGSLAGLTALLSARNHRYGNAWSKGLGGLQGSTRPAIAVSEDVHYSVHRAAGILGIGTDQVVRLPVDESRRICMERLGPTLDRAADQGSDVFCLVASAGTTPVGAVDHLDALADVAEQREMWFHVDGAHGGSLLVSDQLRPRLKGIERADSFSLDAHKTLFMPAMCTLLFYRDKEKSYGAFSQEASYVFEKEPNIYTTLDSAEQNFECTKRPMIMNLWLTWSLYGRELFAHKLEYLCGLAERAYQVLADAPNFATIHKPQTNILCFRYLPKKLGDRNIAKLQEQLRDGVRQAGKFFISKVDLDGVTALRVVFMNHRITMEHFHLLLQEIEAQGQELLGESSSGAANGNRSTDGHP